MIGVPIIKLLQEGRSGKLDIKFGTGIEKLNSFPNLISSLP